MAAKSPGLVQNVRRLTSADVRRRPPARQPSSSRSARPRPFAAAILRFQAKVKIHNIGIQNGLLFHASLKLLLSMSGVGGGEDPAGHPRAKGARRTSRRIHAAPHSRPQVLPLAQVNRSVRVSCCPASPPRPRVSADFGFPVGSVLLWLLSRVCPGLILLRFPSCLRRSPVVFRSSVLVASRLCRFAVSTGSWWRPEAGLFLR